MTTSRPVSDGARVESRKSMYEAPAVGSSKARGDSRLYRGVTGAVTATAAWFVLSELGVPQLAGMGLLGALPLLIVFGALAGLTRLLRMSVWLTASLTLLLLVIGFTDIIEAPARQMLRSDEVPASADAIVVLSSGVTADGLLPQQALDRILKGVELARSGVAPRIVLTRERKLVNGRWISTSADQERLVALSGAEVIATGIATSTRDEGARVARIARHRGWRRIVVVTSAFHARRACATFEKTGLAVSCVPADSRDIAVRTLSEPGDRVRAFAMLSYEMAGTLRYRIAGWL